MVKQRKEKANLFNIVAEYRGRNIIFLVVMFEVSNIFKFYFHDRQSYFARWSFTEMLHEHIGLFHLNGVRIKQYEPKIKLQQQN
jgi:hypothetical protein